MNRFTLLFAAAAFSSVALAQDRLTTLPGYQDARELRSKMAGSYTLARLAVSWINDSTFTYQEGNEWVVFDCKSLKETRQANKPEIPVAPNTGGGRTGRQPGRGRQFTEVFSPANEKVKAVYKDNNVWIDKGDGTLAAVTTDGSAATKVKYGSGSWVYGEELDQRDAMGFSPDGKKLWYYRFDESKVLDYHLALGQNTPQTTLYTEAYPKPGKPNPEVDLYVYDVDKGTSAKVNCRPGLFDEGTGHYVYGIRWAPSGGSLLFYRTDRKQKVLEYCAANPATGAVKVLDREENPTGWVENSYPTTYLDTLTDAAKYKDFQGKALWMSERSGFTNFYLLDLVNGGAKPLTQHDFEVNRMLRFDMEAKVMYYMANNGTTPGMMQLNRIGLDGKGHTRITDPNFSHDVSISPKGSFIVDTTQTVEKPPVVQLINSSGKVLKVLKTSDLKGLKDLGFNTGERISYLSADGKTKLQGVMYKPPKFDPNKKYPVLLEVYGGPLGPLAWSWSENFRMPDSTADYGFIVLTLENRGQGGRGRVFKNALYQNMGQIEIDDQTEGVKSILDRPYVDKDRVGVTGTSYGGYATLMCLFRHPDVFKAGVSNSCVGDWRNYDTTYTERYMGLMPESKDAYDRSSPVTYAKYLKGWLMIYYGTADDNTHPTNAFQVIRALQNAGKYFEVQVGVDAGHSAVNGQRQMEFFVERLLGSERIK